MNIINQKAALIGRAWFYRLRGLTVAICLSMSACSTFVPTPPGAQELHSRAFLPPDTRTRAELRSLPEPVGVIAAAVYNFRDQTGQYRSSPSNALSTAVTQGADNILIDAMLDTGWFSIVERASLQNLLTERKIRQSQLVESGIASGSDVSALPPVAAAQIILEGAVVSYDSNLHTGGNGLRILGVGGSQQYREDRVTVSLRAVNIENGLVLHSVTASKRVFSREITGGVFAYIDDDVILEAEAGRTTNEPAHVAISEAIESALIRLIAEGILENSWQLAEPDRIRDPAFSRFVSESSVDRFVAEKQAQKLAWQERQDRLERVRLRMEAGRKSVQEIAGKYDAELAAALAQSRRVGRARVAAEEARQASLQSPARHRETTRSQASVVATPATPEGLAVQRLVEQQASAVLRAQAQIQVQATEQAYRAARAAYQRIADQQAAAVLPAADSEHASVVESERPVTGKPVVRPVPTTDTRTPGS